MDDPGFFERLYFGFQAEYLVAGQLFGAGFEAFKLPADFGYDLMVTSQRHTTLGSASRIARDQDKPYVIQVKSRRVAAGNFSEGPNQRPEANIAFRIKASEYDLLVDEPSSFLVLVAYLPSIERVVLPPTLCVWLSGPQLRLLMENSYLSEERSGTTLQLRLDMVARLKPRQTRAELLARLRNNGQLTDEGVAELERTLPETLDLNWSASEYVSLLRQPWSRSEGGFYGAKNVAKALRSKYLDISQIHPVTEFPTADDCLSFPKNG